MDDQETGDKQHRASLQLFKFGFQSSVNTTKKLAGFKEEHII